MSFESVCISVQGAGHKKRGMPREDYGASSFGSFFDVFAVADGHGDSNCPRSNLGSRFASEIAIDHLASFAQSLRATLTKSCIASDDIWEDDGYAMPWDAEPDGPYRTDDTSLASEDTLASTTNWESELFGPKEESLVRQLIRSIVGHWNEKVNDHFEANPLSEEERAGCDRYLERYDRNERIEHIYGTTLIAGLVTDTYVLLLQQGDGRCVLFDGDGNATQPIPWDNRCIANVCTSLCNVDAIESFRYYLAPRERSSVAACLAGSDGVEDSFFSMDQMHSYYRELLCYAVEHGVPALNNHLEETLSEFSARGSQDDVTICGLIDLKRVTPLVDSFRRQNELATVQSQRSRITDRLESMSGKMEHLRSRYASALAQAKKEEQRLEGLLDNRQVHSQELDSMRPHGFPLFSSPVAGYRIILEKDHALQWRSRTESQLAEMDAQIEQARRSSDEAKRRLELAKKELRDYEHTHAALEQELARQDGHMQRLKAASSVSHASGDTVRGGHSPSAASL